MNLNNAGSYFLLILEFVGIALGSIVVGLALGLLACVICKHTHLKKHPSKEITVLFLFAYAAYALGELMDLSGIMALFFTGIVLSHYNFHNLSPITQESSTYTFKAFAHSTETVVFAYMGLSLFTANFASWSPWFIVIAVLACLLGRAANTFPLSFLANLKRKKPIPMAMQFVIWFAGLRGAIAFALSLNMPLYGGKWANSNEFVETTTLAIVMFTTLVCGSLTAPILDRFGMKTADPAGDEEDEGELGDYQLMYRQASTPKEAAAISKAHRAGGFHRFWKVIDNRYMKPLFGGKAKAKYLSTPKQSERAGLMANPSAAFTSASSASFVGGGAPGGYGSGTESGEGKVAAPFDDSDSDGEGGDIGAGSGAFFGSATAPVVASPDAEGGGYQPPPAE